MSGVPRTSKNYEAQPQVKKRKKRKNRQCESRSTFTEGMEIIKSSSKETPYRFIKNGVDYTPSPLNDERFSEIKRPFDISDFVVLFSTENYVPNNLPLFLIEDHSAMIDGFLTGSKYGISTFPLERILVHSEPKTEPTTKKKVKKDEAERRPTTYTTFEKTFKVTLQETETIHLLTVDSSLVILEAEAKCEDEEGEEEGDEVEEEEEEEEEKTREDYEGEGEEGAGYCLFEEIQRRLTMPSAEEVVERKSTVKVDEYDIYLQALSRREIQEKPVLNYSTFDKTKAINTDRVVFMCKSLAVSPSLLSYSYNEGDVSTMRRDTIDDQFRNIDLEHISKSVLDSITFKDVFHLMERTLEHYYYKKEHNNLQRNLIEDISKHHSLSAAMRFKLTKEVCSNKTYEVTSISWHPLNRNLIGIGYGKMHSEKRIKTGMFCIWNIKCPRIPERAYKLEYPVTCIEFNEYYPYVAAVGFITGHAALVNILFQKLSIIGDNFHHTADMFPVTNLSWFKGEFGGYSPVISTGAGYLYRFKTENEFVAELILDLPRKHNVSKGIQQTMRSITGAKEEIEPLKVGISTFAQHPKDPLTYLVGTDDGLVHICTSTFKLRDTDVFAAHDGPVTSIDFHPFTHKLFLTTGCDNSVRLWTTCILNEPLLTLSARKDYVRKAKWCTTYPMIIFAMSEAYIDVWDLTRPNCVVPTSTYENVDRTNNLTFNVSPFGSHLVVGCEDGVAELLMMTEREDEPKFSLDTLFRALRNHIENTNELLWKQLQALIPEFNVEIYTDGSVDVLKYLD